MAWVKELINIHMFPLELILFYIVSIIYHIYNQIYTYIKTFTYLQGLPVAVNEIAMLLSKDSPSTNTLNPTSSSLLQPVFPFSCTIKFSP